MLEIKQIEYLLDSHCKSLHYNIYAFESLVIIMRNMLYYDGDSNDEKAIEALENILEQFDGMYNTVDNIRKTKIR